VHLKQATADEFFLSARDPTLPPSTFFTPSARWRALQLRQRRFGSPQC